MSEFKGTKGKWVYDDTDIVSLENDKAVQVIVKNPSPYSEYRQTWEANALLISKAPEMLEMLEKISLALEMFNPPSKETALNWSGEIKQLIKEATTL